MYEVVKRTKRSDVIIGPLPWGEAYLRYAKLAKKFDDVDDEGNYKHPGIRISIRKAA
jgi:hypothetical protein